MSLRGIPLLILSLIIYNFIVYFPQLFGSHTSPQDIFYGTQVLDSAGKNVITKGGDMLNIMLPKGTVRLRLADIMLALGIVLMGFEMAKATYTRGFGLVDRLLSPLLFVLFLVEFLLVPVCATSVFFLLTVMAGFDVVVGEVVGIRSAARNISFGGNN